MKILIIGNGGREYSIGLRLSKDKDVKKLFFAPGNGATLELGENVPEKDLHKLASFAKKEGIDLTIVGPEDPLSRGVVDIFKESELVIFGPSQEASKLESSKAFMKAFASRYALPTAKYQEVTDLEDAKSFIDSLELPIVVKADGLCAGKGVVIATSKEEALKATEDMLAGSSFGDAGKKVIIEEYLDGFEVSVFAICDGKDYKILPPCQDHKRLLDGNKGPNTGGMGAYCPTPLADKELLDKVEKKIIRPTLSGMEKDGAPFVGVLYCGIMVIDDKPYLLEFNVRFGDPECQVIMPLLKGSVAKMFYKAATESIGSVDIKIKDKFAIGVVAASKNYPYSASEPVKINIDKGAKKVDDAHICYAGVTSSNEHLYTNGGRILLSVGVGDSLKSAQKKAYKLMEHIHFEGKQFRKDIGFEVLGGNS